jgi:hypothetical protein
MVLAECRRVPSLEHEAFVELFRSEPELACELLALCSGLVLPHEVAELGSIDLSEVVSVEYRADAVIAARGSRKAIFGSDLEGARPSHQSENRG